jgi:hypothetical protein
MPDALHFPRLSVRGVRALIAVPGFQALTWQERRDHVREYLTFATSGGARVTDERLEAIRARLVQIAVAHGFPGSRIKNFDAVVAIALIDEDLAPPVEALRNDVWAFYATVLLADVSHWRWAMTQVRYLGGVRNTFQRLWMRARAFRRQGSGNVWETVEGIGEDVAGGLLERPLLSGARPVSQTIGDVWLELEDAPRTDPVEFITRQALINLRKTNQMMNLEALSPGAREQEVRRLFRHAGAGV